MSAAGIKFTKQLRNFFLRSFPLSDKDNTEKCIRNWKSITFIYVFNFKASFKEEMIVKQRRQQNASRVLILANVIKSIVFIRGRNVFFFTFYSFEVLLGEKVIKRYPKLENH